MAMHAEEFPLSVSYPESDGVPTGDGRPWKPRSPGSVGCIPGICNRLGAARGNQGDALRGARASRCRDQVKEGLGVLAGNPCVPGIRPR
jgi:hypothetical protein